MSAGRDAATAAAHGVGLGAPTCRLAAGEAVAEWAVDFSTAE